MRIMMVVRPRVKHRPSSTPISFPPHHLSSLILPGRPWSQRRPHHSQAPCLSLQPNSLPAETSLAGDKRTNVVQRDQSPRG
jgi:hypothetical protein